MANVDFNNIFFGRHEGGHKIITLLVLAMIIGIAIVYQYTQKPAAATNPYAAMCGKFPAVEGEVRCEEAVKLVLEKYPGEVYGVEKGKMTTKTEVPGKAVYQDAWLVGINVETPIKLPRLPEEEADRYTSKIEVGVDVQTKNVRLYKLLE